MNKSNFVSGAVIKKQYGVSTPSLHRWADEGKLHVIRLPGGGRLYNKQDIQQLFGEDTESLNKKKVCYARVSSEHQRGDLERQISDLQQQFPTYEIIRDIGSGLNWKRKGFSSLLERVYKGEIQEVVVTHKDRLCRFGYELVEWIFQKAGTKIVVLSHSERSTINDSQELAEDLLAITTVFVARNNGLRAGQKRRERKQREAQEKEKEDNPQTKRRKIDTKEGEESSSSESDEDTSLPY